MGWRRSLLLATEVVVVTQRNENGNQTCALGAPLCAVAKTVSWVRAAWASANRSGGAGWWSYRCRHHPAGPGDGPVAVPGLAVGWNGALPAPLHTADGSKPPRASSSGRAAGQPQRHIRILCQRHAGEVALLPFLKDAESQAPAGYRARCADIVSKSGCKLVHYITPATLLCRGLIQSALAWSY
jgi:hypothetical protein